MGVRCGQTMLRRTGVWPIGQPGFPSWPPRPSRSNNSRKDLVTGPIRGSGALQAIRTPGPLRAFGERIRARRGANIATVAVALKLAVLCWHLLTREEGYAFARPSLFRQKVRLLELAAGDVRRIGYRNPVRVFATPAQHRLEREVGGCGRHHWGAHLCAPQGASTAAGTSPGSWSFARGSPHPRPIVKEEPGCPGGLDFHP
jgi:hypothetical protein